MPPTDEHPPVVSIRIEMTDPDAMELWRTVAKVASAEDPHGPDRNCQLLDLSDEIWRRPFSCYYTGGYPNGTDTGPPYETDVSPCAQKLQGSVIGEIGEANREGKTFTIGYSQSGGK